jgi:hypothetical protein
VKGIRKKEDPYNASMSSLHVGKECQAGTENSSRSPLWAIANGLRNIVIAGFFTGGALAVRGGAKAARNSAIMCACFLAVIEGVGIGFQRMMAENTRLDVSYILLSRTDPSFKELKAIVLARDVICRT